MKTFSVNGAEIFSKKQVEKAIKKLIYKNLTKAISLAVPDIKSEIQGLIEDYLRASDTINAIVKGGLRGHLGLTKAKAESAVESIIRAVVSTIEIESSGKITRGSNKKVLVITTQPSNFKNLSSILQSPIKYYSKRQKKTVSLEWLDWLLFEGDRIIISEFHYDGRSEQKGRSGLGTMKKGGIFRISPAYSGTEKDNFISRAFDGGKFQESVSLIVQRNIQKHWK